MTDYPRGRDVSDALTEVRTVLKRAETAAWLIRVRRLRRDPDEAEMLAALDEVAQILDRWRRTGRPRKT